MKTATKVIALLMSICIGAFASLAEITTGWQSPLTSTTYTWSDTVNWVDDEINGIFSEGLVGSGKTYPNIVFSADAALSGGLVLAYTNNEQYVTFRGDGPRGSEGACRADREARRAGSNGSGAGGICREGISCENQIQVMLKEIYVNNVKKKGRIT